MYVIKGINNLVATSPESRGKTMYIKITDEFSHTTIKGLTDAVTRFKTKEEAEETAKRQIIGAFESFVIEKVS